MTLNRHRAARVAATGLAVALVAGACGTGGDDGGGGGTGGGGQKNEAKKGGTLNVLELSDFEHIDPQRTYVGTALNVGRLLYRTLVTFKSEPGPASTEIVPDLATDLGRPSDNNKTWEFTLKDGLKWQDGSALTCQDLKYGVERSYSELITDGPQYAQQYVTGSEDYKGPYVGDNNGGKGLTGVECKDDKTIVYKLKQPIGDFNFTTTMPQFSPVKKEKDTREKYDESVFSHGPYKIESYVKDKNLTLVRNENWDQKTDQVRKALPDRIVFTFGLEATLITQRLIQDQGEDQTAIQLDSNVAPENVEQVLNDPKLKARTVAGYSGFNRYIAINTAKVKDLKCRQALVYGMNREAYRGVLGGATAGEYATTFITPALKSHKPFDVYGLKDKPQGDPEKAKQLLAESGAACPKRIKFDFANTETGQKVAAAVVESYKRIGITVTPNPIERKKYYATVGKTAVQNELTLAGWGPDWPNGSSVIPPIFDGRQIRPEGNQILSQFNDPEINKLIDEANAETDLDKQAKLWGELDQKVQEKAPVIMLLYDKTLILRGSRVTNAYMHGFFGSMDMSSLGVA